MSLRKALLMLVVLLALGGYVYFVELPREREEAQKKLFAFDKDAVAAVSLIYPDRSLALEKDATGKWRLTQPIAVEADEATVSNLVNAIAEAEVNRVLEDDTQNLALYGLDKPVVKLEVTLRDGTKLPQVSIGKDTPVGFSVYVQKAGDPKIFLTPQAFRLGMTKEVKDVRDKTIVAFEPQEVKKIELRKKDQEIVLSKNDAGWTLEKPLSDKADDTQVQSFLSSVRGMRAQDFVDQPVLELEEYGLVSPRLTVSLTVGSEGAQKTVLLGGEKDDQGGKKLYVKRGDKDTLFLVGDWVLRDLNKTANDFRDKTVVRFDEEKAAKITVTRRDGETFTLSRGEDKKWSIDKTQDGTLKETALTQFVRDLRELRGFEIAAENPSDLGVYGLQEPALKIAVYDGTGASLATVLAGQKTAGDKQEIFAMAEGKNTVFALRDYVFDRVNKKAADFWEKPAEKKTEEGETGVKVPESDAQDGAEEEH
jgi:hypothetical protein